MHIYMRKREEKHKHTGGDNKWQSASNVNADGGFDCFDPLTSRFASRTRAPKHPFDSVNRVDVVIHCALSRRTPRSPYNVVTRGSSVRHRKSSLLNLNRLKGEAVAKHPEQDATFFATPQLSHFLKQLHK